MTARVAAVAAVVAALVAIAPASARAAGECRGLVVCVPVAGPWVVVPTSARVPRPTVEYQLSCPRGYVVGGIDARLSHRAIDVRFFGRLGAPVTPGVTTARVVVFSATHVGVSARAPSFRPFIGCMPSAGGAGRIPTSLGAFRPGEPSTRRVVTARVRAGSRRVVAACAARERLVAASHAIGFLTSQPPAASVVGTVTGRRSVSGRRVAVAVRADAELDARAVVQVHAVCSRAR